MKKGLSRRWPKRPRTATRSPTTSTRPTSKRIADAGKAKIQKLAKDDVAAWRKAMEPVWKKFEADIGRDLIDAALKSNK